jgi:phosphohistidine phosphatase
MIRIYLVRHGIAIEPGGGVLDESRWLTAKGRRRFQRLARAFARLGEPLDHLFSSPLVRAVQTAEILTGPARHGDVTILEELRPDGGVGRLLAELARRVKDEEAVALVGHDPQMSALVAALGEVPKDRQVEFRKGSIVRIDVGALPSARPSQPRWWLKPKSRELAKGLPLRKTTEEKAAAKKTAAEKAKTAAEKTAAEAPPAKVRPPGAH